jgi:carbon-monoxide dehydrogenase medium subunit
VKAHSGDRQFFSKICQAVRDLQSGGTSLKWFDYASPATVGEAVGLLAEHGERSRVLAGGTDLLVQMRSGKRTADFVVDIKRIPELNELSCDPKAGLTLGAAVPCYQVYRNSAVVEAYPGLIDVASMIGGTLIQGRASIGGNLCNAAPSADAVPMLIALEAKCRIAGAKGEREVAVEDFCTGPGQTLLRPGELLVALHFPAPKVGSGAKYLRFIPRNEMDIAVVGAGVSVVLSNGNFVSARIALAAVAPAPLLVKEAGEALAGKPVNEENIERAAEIARRAARPINDMRGTIEYRQQLCAVLTRRTLQGAIERARKTTNKEER